jgi:preprotein translocase subunit SecY
MASGISATQGLKTGSKFADLRRRLMFLVLALVVYRIGAHIPVPGIDPDQLSQLFNSQRGGILGMFNLFSGGALSVLQFLRWASCLTFLPQSSCSC